MNVFRLLEDSSAVLRFEVIDQNNQLICRWDNAPHHPHLSTFPSHCHRGDVLVQSTVISLDEVLEEIRQAL
jgi:hypothetical protein